MYKVRIFSKFNEYFIVHEMQNASIHTNSHFRIISS